MIISGLSESRYRIGIIGAMVFTLSIVLPVLHPLLIIMALCFSGWGVHELIRLADARKFDPSHLVAVPFALLLTGLGTLPHTEFSQMIPSAVSALIAMAFVAQLAIYGSAGSLAAVPLTVFSTLYIGLPLGFGLHLVLYDHAVALMVILGTWACDTGAFLIGCRFGKHKMAPSLSPKKSWEGLVGGVGSCMGVCFLFERFVAQKVDPGFCIPTWQVLTLGGLVAVASVIGDLSESVLKRDAAAKDSGRLFGGHGGVLDRTDSMLFVFIITYLFLSVTGYLNGAIF